MAKKDNKEQKFDKLTGRSLLSQLEDQYKASDTAIETIRQGWDSKEMIFFGKTDDDISDETKSQVYDPRLSSIVMERSARVMAQVPTGKIKALTKANSGKARLINLVFDKYVIPNANTQFNILTKLRLMDLYSLVYGSFGVLVDWVVKDSYVGPDFYLIPIRNLHPQPGVYQIEEMDYCFVDSEVTLGWLLDQPRDTWDNVDKIYDKIGKDGSGRAKEGGEEERSWVEREFSPSQGGGEGEFAKILIRTRYERDRWVTYAPDYDVVLRDIPNPHDNHKIPIVMKHAFPLLDRFYGMGEFERAESLQKAINSLINLYLDGIKYSIFPPTVINPDGVVASSLKIQPGARWLETIPNSIREHQISPQGINTFTGTYKFLIAALMNQAGTTDTTVSRQTDPSMGKTPQAIEFMAAKEASRDNWDRFMMERTVEKVFDRMINLIATKQEKPIEMNLFAEDIEEIESMYPDVLEMVTMEGDNKIVIDKEVLGDTEYKYYIDAGTTMKKDEALENKALTNVLTLLMKNPQIMQVMQQQGKSLDVGELLKRWIITSGVQDWDKIITDAEQMAQRPEVQQAQQQQLKEAAGQLQDPRIRQVAEQLFAQGGPGGMPNGA